MADTSDEIVRVQTRIPDRLLKRKRAKTPSNAAKRAKVAHSGLEGLPWKAVSRATEAGLGDYGDVLMLEEVDGVDVVYEGEGQGRVAKFQILESSPPSDAKAKLDEESNRHGDRVQSYLDSFDVERKLPNWAPFGLHPQLAAALHAQAFFTPTPIQSRALTPAMNGKDVIGVAQTGSGKTLAYGLPILHHLLTHPRQSRAKRQLQALVLTPTRELALQVTSHLKACLIDTTNAASKLPPGISVAAVVGGMSVQKQRRILSRGVDVLVATPGRLWDLLGEDDDLALQVKSLRFLILDEADRMIQAGHFAELDNILRLTLRVTHIDDEGEGPPANTDSLQTFVFSATLSKDLQRNLKKRFKGPLKSKDSTLDDLLLKLDFRDATPEIVDLSPEGGVVSTLQESKIECVASDKDAYLYFFLLRYTGRSVVFVASINGIRRLQPLMELLNLSVFPLHSELQQRQRLKNLDRFKSSTNSVLLATDIAARGLDIPSVDHVIHYQIPRSTDSYVHRNGRTARAMRSGFTLLLCAPDERKILRAILGDLNRRDDEIPDMAVDHGLLDQVKQRIRIARQIDSSQHRAKKQTHERNWMKEAADALEIELSDSEAHEPPQRSNVDSQIKALKSELKSLLSQPLMARGVSAKYITSGSRAIADDLVTGDYHEEMLGLKSGNPRSQLLQKTRSARTSNQKQK